jgi:hypothetical protein
VRIVARNNWIGELEKDRVTERKLLGRLFCLYVKVRIRRISAS